MTANVTVAAEAPVGEGGRAPEGASRRSDAVFAAVVVAALPVFLWFGRHHWFFLDEWWGLGRSEAWHPGYLDGHNGHWLTLTRVQYRLTFELFGLRTYLPYQLPTVVAHLGTAVLLRQVSRRCGVRAWIATAVAVAFVFFGTGYENILWGWQSNTTGSLVCGFALFLLVDGPSAVTRRDWLALGLGIVGLMTSAAFVGIVVGLGVTIVLRRGLRVAAFYTVPLATIYLAWYAAYGSESNAVPFKLTTRTLWFVGRMSWAVFDALAQGGIGVVLLALAGIGLASALSRAAQSGDWADVALPAGLTVAWLVFAGMTALGRALVPLSPNAYATSRYVHVGAALLLPVAALGAERLARRRALLGALALVPLAIGLPGNVDRMANTPAAFTGGKDTILAIAHSRYLDDVPPDTMPLRIGGGLEMPVTADWLSRQVDAGRVPEPDGADPVRDLTATSQIVLTQDAGPTDVVGCPPLSADVPVTLHRGDQLPFDGALSVFVTDRAHTAFPRSFHSRDGPVIRTLAGPVDVIIRPTPGVPTRLCTPPPG